MTSPTLAPQATADVDLGPIYLSPPDMSPQEREALLRAFDSGWVAPAGPELDAFEAELAAYVGVEACAAISSGTGALHLALLGAGVQPGDRVVVQTATFAASAFAVTYAGAEPVFCDVSRSTWNIDPERLGAWLERQPASAMPAAVMAVDLYGLCPDYAELRRVCDRFAIALVEDAAEALGSIAGGRNAATFGDLSALSFNGNKIVTTSGGGALLGSADAISRAKYLATQARQPVPWYEHDEIGFNYRMSNLLAALGRAQLSRLERGIARRWEIRERYRQAFADFTWLDSATTERPNCWLSAALLPVGVSPIEVCAALATERIEARPLWKPMHAQPVFARSERIGGEVADLMFDRGICLPSGSSLTDEDQTRVIVALAKALDRI
ncbi:MAG: aminotransferase class I/II-fold pyridoxal phosphate-dependent enzyme [Acidimicrobiales bacterium]